MTKEQRQGTSLGDPLAMPCGDRETTGEPRSKSGVKEAGSDFTRREGDTGLGTPEFEPHHERELSREESEAHQREMNERMRQRAEEILNDLEHSEGWKMPKGLRNGLSVLLLVLAAVLGMFLTTEAVQFAGDAETLQGGWRWVATTAMFLFGGILAAVLLGLVWATFRLQRSPHVHPQALKVLAERKKLQHFAVKKQEKARKLLRHYLHEYPLDGKGRKRLASIGLSAEDLTALAVSRDILLDESRHLRAETWLEAFHTDFQAILDRGAQRRIGRLARRIALGTAASPIRFIDQMLVLYGCMALVKDMFTLYQLRPAFGQTAVILARSVIHAYLSGMFEDVADQASDAALNGAEELAGDGLGALTGTLGKAISARTAEASLNALLIWRLGKKTITLLQPVVPQDS